MAESLFTSLYSAVSPVTTIYGIVPCRYSKVALDHSSQSTGKLIEWVTGSRADLR
jgi:hypothetical protein